MIRPDEVVREAEEEATGDTEEEQSAVEGTDACLAGTLFVAAVERDRGRSVSYTHLTLPTTPYV